MASIDTKRLNSALQLGMALSTVCALFDVEESEIESYVQSEFGLNLDTYRAQLLAGYELNARIHAANFAKGVPVDGDEQVHREVAKKLFKPLGPSPEALVAIGGHQLPVTQVRSVETKDEYSTKQRRLLYYLVINRTDDAMPLANTVIPFLTAEARAQAQQTLHQARQRATLPDRR